MAEKRGFEPRIPCGIHDFQSCALGRTRRLLHLVCLFRDLLCCSSQPLAYVHKVRNACVCFGAPAETQSILTSNVLYNTTLLLMPACSRIQNMLHASAFRAPAETQSILTSNACLTKKNPARFYSLRRCAVLLATTQRVFYPIRRSFRNSFCIFYRYRRGRDRCGRS